MRSSLRARESRYSALDGHDPSPEAFVWEYGQPEQESLVRFTDHDRVGVGNGAAAGVELVAEEEC